MPNLNHTIDRSIAISRDVATTLERRIREASAAYYDRVRKAQAAYTASGARARAINTPNAVHDNVE
jgi:hypothetical protein